VLLVDRASFPREKPCGCCLSAHAVALLRQMGLSNLLQLARPLNRFDCFWAAQQATVSISGGVALSRRLLDTELIQAAIDAGAEFLPSTSASPGQVGAQSREVLLSNERQSSVIRGNVVIVAGGLSWNSIRADALGDAIDRRSRIGAQTTIDDDSDYPAGAISMVCAQSGYVGLVRVEEGQLNVAGAFDLEAVRSHGGPGPLAAAVLRSTGLPAPPALADAHWRGTPRLTHRRQHVAAERMFLIGDAAGYVEPFTGEGMAWALESAVLVAPIAQRACSEWSSDLADRWQSTYRRAFRPRQQLCWLTTRLLRHRIGLAALFALLEHAPAISHRLVRFFHGTETLEVTLPTLQPELRT
jgi:menaquinone-9 beta-reductase